MINEEKWIHSLKKLKIQQKQDTAQIDYKIWENTVAKKNTYSSLKNYSLKNYSLIGTLFVFGLLLVSVVKNETRNLQKEINHLETSINLVKYNLNQANLDNEVLTSPDNISRLAKQHLNINLVSYKKSQIRELNNYDKNYEQETKKKKEKKITLSKNIKSKIEEKIKKKKKEMKKIQEMYSNPKSIPSVVKVGLKQQIEEKKNGLKKIYKSPKDAISIDKAQKWVAVQIVKVILGMPIVPGK